MSMNIKNEHVHELAREAARRTGKSQTRVVEDSSAIMAILNDEPESHSFAMALASARNVRAAELR